MIIWFLMGNLLNQKYTNLLVMAYKTLYNNLGKCICLFYPLFILLLFFITPNLYSQNKGVMLGYKIENGDTLFVDNIAPVYLFNKDNKRRESRAWREYYRTIYNFKKVYPYALKAKVIIQEADSVLANSNFNKREREKYLKEYEKRLFKEFEKPLRSLSYSQGRLLLRLLDRELGLSAYYLIKNYRGGAAAGFWQGVSKLFSSDLKRRYDKFGADKPVEELVEMYHKGVFDYLYYSMFRE